MSHDASIQERVRAGLARAKHEGKHLGQPGSSYSLASLAILAPLLNPAST
jgi:hypothetical protein